VITGKTDFGDATELDKDFHPSSVEERTGYTQDLVNTLEAVTSENHLLYPSFMELLQ
jgi:hypothetical protein